MKSEIKSNRRFRRSLLIAGIALGLIGLVSIGIYVLMNSRTFQLFGGLTSRVETTDKVVALTFDDGPEPGTTEDTLKILEDEKIKATFMLIGSAMRAHPDQAKMIVAAGHQIGNHSYSHDRMVFKPYAFYKEEVEKTDAAIRGMGYQGDIVFRPPFGKKLVGLPHYLHEHNRRTIMWDVEPETQAGQSAPDIVNATLREVRPGSIILLHTMNEGRASSMQALKPIIQRLKAEGYRFVTVDELLEH